MISNIYTRLSFIGLVLCLLWIFPADGNAHDTPRVLFVGNSFTFFYNMPQGVQAMCMEKDVPLNIRQSTVGGSTWEQHWKEQKGTQTRKMIEDQAWDYIVFQNHSMSPIKDSASFMEYGLKFAELARTKGAEPVFMMTWAYASNPLMQSRITSMYRMLAKKANAHLVPVGEVFRECRDIHPQLDLFFDDKHPSETGTYLIALTFTKFFTGESVLGLPKRITTKDRNDEKLYLYFLEEDEAKYLQQLVDNFEIEPLKKQN